MFMPVMRPAGKTHRQVDELNHPLTNHLILEAIKEPDWMTKILRPADLEPTYEQKLVEMLHRRDQAFAKHEDDIGRTTHS